MLKWIMSKWVGGLDCIRLVWDRDQFACFGEHISKLPGSIGGREFLAVLTDCKLIMKDNA